ncbi:hypothetical protein DP939_21085 [Spongiactinospora rosea]|uniref:Uncharacterized protein n=1 Tax=Spongiactinospora rosea TaxID=2248750 RepID=A0A366LYV1_9ACTN|nr:hypothetical protein [Spongiactinospora rosea]RBQ18362.1 hypothetical protein DP939_21085 [Spongiactinospora rosea]
MIPVTKPRRLLPTLFVLVTVFFVLYAVKQPERAAQVFLGLMNGIAMLIDAVSRFINALA